MAPRSIILGCGTPIPDTKRWGSSFVVDLGASWMMFDCGFGATHKLYEAQIAVTDVDTLFLTHHHSDHVADYPGLLLSRFDMATGHENPLNVYGPDKTIQLTERLIGPDQGAFWPDIVARTSHPLSLGAYKRRGGVLPRRPPQVETSDLESGVVVEGSEWTVRTAEVKHVQPYLDSLAYRLETNAGSMVFAGDTRACSGLTELATDADMLFMACVRLSEDMREDPAYGAALSGSREAALTAEAAGVEHLVLVHQHPAMNAADQKDRVLREVSSIYGGKVTWGEEGLEIP